MVFVIISSYGYLLLCHVSISDTVEVVQLVFNESTQNQGYNLPHD